ncbi:MAG: hypothetical protein GVY11_07250 [Gammaproteobacteria bacterium]|jgi:hypothetical protein|nr:hypothetical protein [Gammaproteobacteria bacterium]
MDYRNQLVDLAEPQRLKLKRIEGEVDELPVVSWNGTRIPIPDMDVHSVALILHGIAGVLSDRASVLFSKVDLAPHFERFDGIAGFGQYVQHRDSIVQWLDEGVSIRPDDIVCQPFSMHADLVRIVHSLVAGINLTVTEETVLMRLQEPVPALLEGRYSGGGRDVRVRLLFQYPRSDRSQLMTVTYQFKESNDVFRVMRDLAVAIAGDAEHSQPISATLVAAILEGDYETAAEVANSEGLEVRSRVQ